MTAFRKIFYLLLHSSPFNFGSGFKVCKPQPAKDSTQLLCGKRSGRLDLCNWSLDTRGFPTASWGRQCQWPWCLYSGAQLISVEQYLFGWKSGAVVAVCQWRLLRMWFIDLQNSLRVNFLEPGLDNKSSDNLCCWIIQAEWEVGPGNCWVQEQTAGVHRNRFIGAEGELKEVLGHKMFWDQFLFASLARAYNLLCSWASGCLELFLFSLNTCGLHCEQCIVPL